jgi:hypothetical protein
MVNLVMESRPVDMYPDYIASHKVGFCVKGSVFWVGGMLDGPSASDHAREAFIDHKRFAEQIFAALNKEVL